jgi:ubiquinone/menaquinone biosynthesis C-methylase UbiE
VGVPNLVFVEADATKLPFDDDEFDAVTISFGLRNVNEPKLALAEVLRVRKARWPPRHLRVLAPARGPSCDAGTTRTSAT